MKTLFIVIAQWLFCSVAAFAFMMGWQAIDEGKGAFIALFSVLFVVGVAGFGWFTMKFSDAINGF